MSKPLKHKFKGAPATLLDPRFRYVPAAQTDVGATWERERKRLAAETKGAAERQAKNDAEAAAKVRPLAARRKP